MLMEVSYEYILGIYVIFQSRTFDLLVDFFTDLRNEPSLMPFNSLEVRRLAGHINGFVMWLLT